MVEFATEDEPEIDRSDQELGRHRHIGVGSKIAPSDAPLENPADFFATSLHDRRPERISQCRVDRDL